MAKTMARRGRPRAAAGRGIRVRSVLRKAASRIHAVSRDLREARREARLGVRPSRARHVLAYGIVGLSLLLFLLALVAGLTRTVEEGPSFEIEEEDIGPAVALFWLFFAAPVVLAVALLAPSPRRFARRLFLTDRRPHRSALLALLVVAGGFLGLVLALVWFPLSAGEKEANPFAGVSWTGILALGVTVAVTEELYFRALLVPRLGVTASALLFGLAHAPNAGLASLLSATAFGLVMGWLMLARRSLWAPVIAHGLWDLALLSAAKLAG